jgi:two-component system cell cycle sensor histidine kinase/response regulator CckA
VPVRWTSDPQPAAPPDVRPWTWNDLGRHAVAVGAVGAAVAATRFTWPLLASTPFVLLFAAIFVGARWTTDRASLLSVALAVMGTTVMTPAGDVQAPQPWAIVAFAGAALAANRIVVGRNRAEKALRASELQYRQLFRDNPQALWVYRLKDQRFLAVNHAALARYGYESAEFLSLMLHDLVLHEDRAIIDASDAAARGSRRHRTKAGRILDVEVDASFVEWRGQSARLELVTDVTERKTLERQFIQAQRAEAVGRLAGGIAHDFNNLLTAILGYTELLQERMPDTPEILADLNEIKSAGERASRLTYQLLAFSRKQTMIRQVVDVNAVVGDVYRMLGRVLGEDIELSVISAPAVWRIVADPGQIEQVLMNLAVNARDAMPKGGRLTFATANVELDDAFVRRHPGAVAGPYVSLTVQDAGCGMTAEVMAHVFEPFFTTKPVGQGTGLGLSTVYGIVKQNGGYITIASEPTSGTTVTVFWPMSDQREAPAPPTVTSERALGGTETILLVEDEAGIRSLMRKTLEPYGYRVLEARDVLDAIAIAEDHDGSIELLLSDVIMPVLSGPDLAQRIVGRRPEIKVCYVSGFPNSLLSEQKREPQRMWFLAKPFMPHALALKVRECLDSDSVLPSSPPVHR